MKIPLPPCFDLTNTLESGQFFQYLKKEDWYYIHTRNHLWKIREHNGDLEYFGIGKNALTHFLSLDEDYASMIAQWQSDPVLATAVSAYPGIRILRQDPWECTLTFLSSQCANMGKIRLNLTKMAETFGKPISRFGITKHMLPRPEEITSLQLLNHCSLGYRAPYIFEASKMGEHFFKKIQKLSYLDARTKLMELPGIGTKVADCILLFGLHHTEAFPVDIWMQRVLTNAYHLTGTFKELETWGRTRWGRTAGYAQQYLYHWGRLNRIKLDNDVDG